MSEVKGCKFYVFNASTGPIDGTITHRYKGTPAVPLSIAGLDVRSMSPMQAFESGNSHTDHWDVDVKIANGQTLSTTIDCSVKQANTMVAIVVNDWGTEIVPQMEKPNSGSF